MPNPHLGEFTSFQNMKKIEQQDGTKSDKLKPADKNDPDSYKTRKGKVKGFVDYLSENEIQFLTHQMKEKLANYFNYN